VEVTASYDNATSNVHAVGNDQATFKPYGFYVWTTTPNSEALSGANSSVFKKAGENFNLSSRAVCWQSDGESVNASDLADNQITPNYSKTGVSISHSLVEPAGGNLGTLGVSSGNFVNGELSFDNQTYSEVGIIKINANDADYLGTGSISGVSANIGRFTPYRFIVNNIVDGVLENKISNLFTYIGQTLTYSTFPTFKITAANIDNVTTQNYKDDFFKLSFDEITLDYPEFDNQTMGKDGSYLDVSSQSVPLSLTSNNNGTADVHLNSDNFTYLRDNNSVVNPFSEKLVINILQINDGDISTSFLDKFIQVSGSNPKSMRFGRMNIYDNYGPETDDLIINVENQYYDSSAVGLWRIAEDSTTAIASANFNLDNYTGNLNSGETSITTVSGISNGSGSITLSAPGEGNEGTVDIVLGSQASYYSYLYDIVYDKSRGTATFGIYRGRDRIIMWKEIPAD